MENAMTQEVIHCDLVVLGAGGSGLVAAARASEDSGTKVLVLEKAPKIGGASYFAGGPGVGRPMGPPGPDGPGLGGPGDPGPNGPGPGGPNRASQDLMAQFSNWFAAKVGQGNMVSAARMEKFKKLPDPSIGPGRGGTFTVEKMLASCKQQGVQILTETPAKKLIVREGGNVTGVLAQTPNGELLVQCKACVIAAGGFGSNYQKLKRYWPEEYNGEEIFFLCPPGMMGDGIDMVEEIGAYIDQTPWRQDEAGGFFASGPMHHPYSWAVQSLMFDGKFVCINLDGNRWKNEDGPGGSLATQPGSVAYCVADEAIVQAVGSQLAGSGMVGPGGRPAAADSNEARAIKKWREDLESEAAIDDAGASGNHVKKADTLAELALKMRIDPKTFTETIARYNGFCQTGNDLDFGKPARLLKPIAKPPFWAIYGHRFSQCTKGLYGIAVNCDFEVLDPKGEAMPGLFAAGDTCTIYGGLVLQMPGPGTGKRQSGDTPAGNGKNILTTAPSPCGGAMAAFVSGYAAGARAAAYLKNR